MLLTAVMTERTGRYVCIAEQYRWHHRNALTGSMRAYLLILCFYVCSK